MISFIYLNNIYIVQYTLTVYLYFYINFTYTVYYNIDHLIITTVMHVYIVYHILTCFDIPLFEYSGIGIDITA